MMAKAERMRIANNDHRKIRPELVNSPELLSESDINKHKNP